MGVSRNFYHAMFSAFLRIYTQILNRVALKRDPPRERPDGWDRWSGKESGLLQGFIRRCSY